LRDTLAVKDGATAWSKAPTSLSAHLAESVLALIKDEGLEAGDRLPSVKELAERFSVATPTMREALRLLEMAGNLDIRHGSGIYVRSSESRLMLTNPYARSLSTGRSSTSTRLLIGRRSPNSRRRTRRQDPPTSPTSHRRRRHLRAGSRRRSFGVAMRFHRGIAEGAGNNILADVVFTLTEVHIMSRWRCSTLQQPPPRHDLLS
jgi:GntR family transcriptional repressor for pyruvate dehydrogenase complex